VLEIFSITPVDGVDDVAVSCLIEVTSLDCVEGRACETIVLFVADEENGTGLGLGVVVLVVGVGLGVGVGVGVGVGLGLVVGVGLGVGVGVGVGLGAGEAALFMVKVIICSVGPLPATPRTFKVCCPLDNEDEGQPAQVVPVRTRQ
jgi:hypothetical protein